MQLAAREVRGEGLRRAKFEPFAETGKGIPRAEREHIGFAEGAFRASPGNVDWGRIPGRRRRGFGVPRDALARGEFAIGEEAGLSLPY